MKDFLLSEISGWKKWEISWLLSACIVITGLSIYWQDSLMGIISSLTGVACVVCTGKGKLSAYIFGVINCILYSIISYKATLYGETMLNAIYYLPMQFYGFYIWKNNISSETLEVKKIRMTNLKRIVVMAIILLGTFSYGLILEKMGDAIPFIDAFTTVSSIVAMYLSVKRFSEQWWIWIAVDVFSVIMWAKAYMLGSESVATLLMWTVYLFNAIIMCYKWQREANLNRN